MYMYTHLHTDIDIVCTYTCTCISQRRITERKLPVNTPELWTMPAHWLPTQPVPGMSASSMTWIRVCSWQRLEFLNHLPNHISNIYEQRLQGFNDCGSKGWFLQPKDVIPMTKTGRRKKGEWTQLIYLKCYPRGLNIVLNVFLVGTFIFPSFYDRSGCSQLSHALCQSCLLMPHILKLKALVYI